MRRNPLSNAALEVLRLALDGPFSKRLLNGFQLRAFRALCRSGWCVDGCAVGMLAGDKDAAAAQAILEAAAERCRHPNAATTQRPGEGMANLRCTVCDKVLLDTL